MAAVVSPTTNDPLIHWAIYYNNADDYLGQVVPFLEGALAAGEPALVFAPGRNIDLLRAALTDPAGEIVFLHAADLASNPARIIPTARQFADAHPGRRIRIVGEPIWPGRSAAEIREGIRHEALVNVLFADVAATVLCPYDTAGLDEATIGHAGSTHPHELCDGQYRASALYVDPVAVLSKSQQLPAAPDRCETTSFKVGELATLRGIVRNHARRASMNADRVQDLVIAVNEAATNSLSHSNAGGTLRIWQDTDDFVCEVSDRGYMVTDHVAGRLAPRADAPRGRGLWIINQLCDLVELRSSTSGTIVRMHIRLG